MITLKCYSLNFFFSSFSLSLNQIFGNPSGENLHFYMEVIHHLSEKALDFVKLLCFNHGKYIMPVYADQNEFLSKYHHIYVVL